MKVLRAINALWHKEYNNRGMWTFLMVLVVMLLGMWAF